MYKDLTHPVCLGGMFITISPMPQMGLGEHAMCSDPYLGNQLQLAC